MPFKIVQTTEKGAKYLTVVPSKWEADGVCFFPKNGLTSKQKVEKSVPDQTFLRMHSILKRDNLQSFEEANAILDIVVQQSDTDNEEKDVSANRKVQMKKSAETIKRASVLPDLNEYLTLSQSHEQTFIQKPQTYSQQVLTIDQGLVEQPPESQMLTVNQDEHGGPMVFEIVQQNPNEQPSISTHSMNVSFV